MWVHYCKVSLVAYTIRSNKQGDSISMGHTYLVIICLLINYNTITNYILIYMRAE